MTEQLQRRICWPDPDWCCLEGGCGYCNDGPWKNVNTIENFANRVGIKTYPDGATKDYPKSFRYGWSNRWPNIQKRVKDMTERTVIELCITKDQTSVLSLTMPGDLIPELLAEALYNVKSCWDEPEYAAAGIVGYLCELSKEISLVVGRRRFQHDVLVVDFISKLVSDRVEQKSYKFNKWLERHDVP